LVEEEQRRERLVLRRSRDVALRREPAQERRHLGRAHRRGMALAMEAHEVPDPVPIRLLRAQAVMPRTDLLAHPLDEPFCPFVRPRIRFRSPLSTLSRIHPNIPDTVNIHSTITT